MIVHPLISVVDSTLQNLLTLLVLQPDLAEGANKFVLSHLNLTHLV